MDPHSSDSEKEEEIAISAIDLQKAKASLSDLNLLQCDTFNGVIDKLNGFI